MAKKTCPTPFLLLKDLSRPELSGQAEWLLVACPQAVAQGLLPQWDTVARLCHVPCTALPTRTYPIPTQALGQSPHGED